ncbi:MAG: hypothetical protein HYZ44_15335 [Bacteroidetes bacterium]|nr:hypothetical protein [Bacteroidota bacterium]
MTERNQQRQFYQYGHLVGVLAIMACVLLSSCSQQKVEKVERAFYYWKSNSPLTNKERAVCDTLGVKKLYIKFFEVNFSPERGNFPESKTEWWEGYSNTFTFKEIVPTVYLRNVVFLKSPHEELDILADNINFLITKYANEKFREGTIIQEFQMDCDWTLKSKDNYFYFLTKLKTIAKKQISCTLRLYPFKYPDKMGVPPVDKVTLMCYNLLNPLENPGKNSILDLTELKNYLQDSPTYPLHLDVVLPVYSWAQVYHNERFSEVLYTNYQNLKTNLKQEKPLWYTVLRDTIINETYLRKGDQLKLEEMTAEKIGDAIALLKKNIHFDNNTTVVLFHLDEEQLNQFTNAELASFYSDFSK